MENMQSSLTVFLQDVPFYRAYLNGTKMSQSKPFLVEADDKFFNNSLADTEYHYPIRFYCHPAEHPTEIQRSLGQKLKTLGRNI
jgi:hypothetical protein